MNEDTDYYQEWLDDNSYTDSEELKEEWDESHCQFCGCNNEFGCGCDAHLRY